MAFALPIRCLGSSTSSILVSTARRLPCRTLGTLSCTPRGMLSQRTFLSTLTSSSTRPLPSPIAPLPVVRPSTLRAAVARRSASSATTSTSSSIPPGAPTSLTWNEYLALRTRRRRINALFSAVCALSTMAGGAAFLANQDMEQLNAFSFGLDPMIVLGAATAACGMLGWLLGPFLGGAVFAVLYRRVGGAMRDKEREFFRRIKRNRSDPAGQSMSNPVPDYYGEKITSVRDYRRWLKDQRAFRKKREMDVI